MKRIFKYATGEVIPDGAIYLKTLFEDVIDPRARVDSKKKVRLVWHYFLVEVEE